jgi:hypothetical protein
MPAGWILNSWKCNYLYSSQWGGLGGRTSLTVSIGLLSGALRSNHINDPSN